jgi:hypothetical protein
MDYLGVLDVSGERHVWSVLTGTLEAPQETGKTDREVQIIG